MTRGRLIFTAAAAACLLATLVYGPSTAQTEHAPSVEPPPAGAPAPGPFGPPGGMSEELRETMNLYMVFRLTEELELSDEQALMIMPLIKGREKARWEYFQSQAERQRTLAALVEDEESSDAELENLLTAIRQAKRDFDEHEDQLNLEISALFSSRQYAQFVIFQQRFHNDMRQRVKRLRGMENHDRRHNRSD